MDKFARFRYQPCLPLGEDGKRVTASQKHIQLSRNAASEGMVLLKNSEKALPLKKGNDIYLLYGTDALTVSFKVCEKIQALAVERNGEGN